jgi:hypothetical protein
VTKLDRQRHYRKTGVSSRQQARLVGQCPACRRGLTDVWVWQDKVVDPVVAKMLAIEADLQDALENKPRPEHSKDCPTITQRSYCDD